MPRESIRASSGPARKGGRERIRGDDGSDGRLRRGLLALASPGGLLENPALRTAPDPLVSGAFSDRFSLASPLASRERRGHLSPGLLMCGIVGYVLREGSSREISREDLERMCRTLSHRGPDDEGYHREPRCGLGSRRLSIIDLSSGGRMPIANETADVRVIQNGEIYNFGALRKELTGLGHRFRGRSDTETIVHLYEELGEGCFERLDGMFAIALWDARRRRLLLGRDRFGEKPLYYYDGPDGCFAFASELRAFSALPDLDRELDWAALDQYLSLGYILAPSTPFRCVKKVLPGHFLVVDLAAEGVREIRYWTPAPPNEERSHSRDEEYLDEFRDLLVNAVRGRMVSDVPVGAFLSGGIDSSLIVAAMAEVGAGRARTFSIGSPGFALNDETDVAATVARALGVEHQRIGVSFDEIRDLICELPDRLDEPLGDPAGLGVYLITRAARRHGVTVMLSGDAGDEIFLGYPIHRQAEQLATLFRLPAFARRGLALGLSSWGRITRRSRLEKAGVTLRQPGMTLAAYFLAGHGAWTIDEVSRLRHAPPIDLAASRFARALSDATAGPRPLHRMTRALIETYLPDNNLCRMDRYSMANGVEARAPFLDPRFLQFASRLPLPLKIDGASMKVLPRRALARYVPGSVARRPKHGFDALPMATWLRGDLRFLTEEYLGAERLRRQGLFDATLVRQAVDEHARGGAHNHWWKLWLLIVLQMWLSRWGRAP